MKLPSLFAAGIWPSGSSTDFTISGPNGSRTGAGGLAGRAVAGGCAAVWGGMAPVGGAGGVWAIAAPAPAITPLNNVTHRRRSINPPLICNFHFWPNLLELYRC
jgi:hypothetical protein